jgi:hypothetical protein
MVTNDWYCRLFVESALTELWIHRGEAMQARSQAERFLSITLKTSERTFQALAWEANARVSMAELDWASAQDHIAKALSMIESYEVPLAAWRVHATAAQLNERAGRADLALRSREVSRATVLKLANSLPPDEPLRGIFLSATKLREIVGDLEASGSSAKRAGAASIAQSFP